MLTRYGRKETNNIVNNIRLKKRFLTVPLPYGFEMRATYNVFCGLISTSK